MRASSTQRGYGYRWQQSRAGYLKRHPLCAHCEARGRVTIATDLDHIIPHRGDMALFWDRSNWQGLCASCHSRKTATEDGGFGNVGREINTGCDVNGVPLDPDSHWHRGAGEK